VTLEVKDFLGSAVFLTVCDVTGADAVFTIVGTEVWLIYWSVFAEACLLLSWKGIGTIESSGMANCEI
jgi:hypothetical protein